MNQEKVKTFAFISGIILGGLTIIAALIVFLVEKKMSITGLGTLAIGTILLGLSVWTTFRVELPGGIIVDVETKLKEMEKIVKDIETEKNALINQVQKIEKTANEINTKAVPTKKLQDLRNGIKNIKTKDVNLDRYLMNLESLSRTSKTKIEALKKSTISAVKK